MELNIIHNPNMNKQEKIRRVVRGWKILKGIPEEHKGWDRVHFPRNARYAKQLLDLFDEDLENALDCLEETVKKLQDTDLTWNFATVIRWSEDYIQQKDKK